MALVMYSLDGTLRWTQIWPYSSLSARVGGAGEVGRRREMAAKGWTGSPTARDDLGHRHASWFFSLTVTCITHPLSLAFLTIAEVGTIEAAHIAASTGYQRIGFAFSRRATKVLPLF
ncbi:hypothetical protein LPU83_pLPU83b_0048 (plasmid) [Rhizobium favelukesii]|uniref:Uncharacterized protein n=2 Tax=Rhizobium/Agrobacterium group TaxID=227290 RepID=W6RM84_9HYPH|nr:hypothetical protein LPU83_pLPU83b_0048 [Rhizobium favelukesii]